MKRFSEREKSALLFLTPLLVLVGGFVAQQVITWRQTQRLARAITAHNYETARKAIQSGANVNGRNRDGWTMVMWAVGNNGDVEMIKLLRSAGAQTNATEDLFIASVTGDVSMAQRALASGAQVDALEKDDWTPLMWAADRSFPDVVKILLRAGANPNLKDKDYGKDVREWACYDGGSFEGCNRTRQLLGLKPFPKHPKQNNHATPPSDSP
jgi:ankyrin repeat protein